MNITPGEDAILAAELPARKGHPKGLAVLFSTEMWERFNFYGMRTILTFFLRKSLMMGDADASLIYGGYLGLCYFTPMLGGFIADKYLGNRNCILLGGTTHGYRPVDAVLQRLSFCIQYLGLPQHFMWIALLIIIFGNGFFKPNISSMVGIALYQTGKKQAGFCLYYFLHGH